MFFECLIEALTSQNLIKDVTRVYEDQSSHFVSFRNAVVEFGFAIMGTN